MTTVFAKPTRFDVLAGKVVTSAVMVSIGWSGAGVSAAMVARTPAADAAATLVARAGIARYESVGH